MNDAERMGIALEHMIERSSSYLEEYEKWGRLAAALDMDEAARIINEARESVLKANQALQDALDLIEQSRSQPWAEFDCSR
jgi:hypothetical protein